MKTLKATWMKGPKPGNLGDILNPFLMKKVGINPSYVPQSTNNKFISIGSIAKFIRPGDVVWGTGIMRQSDPIEVNAKYLAVRGPLTGDKVNCNVYGDPALLASKFWPMENTNEFDLGFVPHYVDYKKVDTQHYNQIDLINGNPISVIKEMNRYKTLISTSLHGIILAHAYGIPCGWWKPSNRLNGDGSKFKDYAESVGIILKPETDFKKVKLVLPEKSNIDKVNEDLIKVIKQYLNGI